MKIRHLLSIFIVLSWLAGCNPQESGQDPETDPGNDAAADIVLNTIVFPATPDELLADCDEALIRAEDAVLEIIDTEIKTFANTVAALNNALYELRKSYGLFFLIGEVAVDPGLREAASQATQEISEWKAAVYHDEDLYAALEEVAFSRPDLAGEQFLLLNDFLRSFRRKGIDLPVADRMVLEEIMSRINALEREFATNVTNFDTAVDFFPGELEGLPPSALNLLEEDGEGGYLMDPRIAAEYNAVIEFAVSESTRQTAWKAYYSVAREDNPAILEEIIRLRAEKARLLGYETHADFVTEEKMVGSAAAAITFLEDMGDGLAQRVGLENRELLALKIRETGDADAVLEPWDTAYYQRLRISEEYDLDQEAMKEYFSLGNCLQGMFEVFSESFGIEIVERPAAEGHAWHGDIRFFQVNDAASGDPLGTFYLDLYPREGKYTHFATCFVKGANTFADGTRERPVAVLVGNWLEPGEDTPSLLSFFEVKTLFHEFGHVMNALLLDARYHELNENSLDFVEVHSQIAEQWLSDQAVLDRFAVSYRDPAETIPPDFLEKQLAVDRADIFFPQSIVSRGLTDLFLHTRFDEDDPIDVVGEANHTLARYRQLPVPEDTAWIARFTHLTGGYDAGYYGYLWAYAIAYDLASRFRESPDGFLDPTLGRQLREQIYEPGQSRDEDASVAAFLGREWSGDAYLEYLGISGSAP